ncbi:MAG: hypothetical protein V4718_04390 [Pseudomonadota bacterium]
MIDLDQMCADAMARVQATIEERACIDRMQMNVSYRVLMVSKAVGWAARDMVRVVVSTDAFTVALRQLSEAPGGLFACGGPVKPGRYLVGEAGPNLTYPQTFNRSNK